MREIIALVLIISVSFQFLFAQSNTEDNSEIETMMNYFETDTLFAKYVNWFGGEPLKLYNNFKVNKQLADSTFNHEQENINLLSNIGYTNNFEMLPLIDWFTKNDSLEGEAGVSYLIKTDDTTILFDVGLNSKQKDPSPLLNNMKDLNVNIDDIDIIVISHPHGDHTGGGKWAEQNTFSLTTHQLDLGKKQVYTPIPMTYPDLEPIHTPNSVKIAKGVATIGVIDCPMFHGNVKEQAIAINVKDKGVIVVSGCGHQTIERILQRTEKLFNDPIYGLLGGFHLPISVGRNIGKIYQYFITNRFPWIPYTKEDVRNDISSLKQRNVKYVGISGHDTCDSSIVMFKEEFKSSYIDIIVGENIIF